MVWNASEFGGVTEIMIATDPNVSPYAWTPDLIIREDCGDGMLSNMKLTSMLIRSNGSFYNEIFGEIVVIFSPDLEYYPYDDQNVTITIGSSSYNNQRLDLQPYANPFLVADPNTFNLTNIEWTFGDYDYYIYNETSDSGVQRKFQFTFIA